MPMGDSEVGVNPSNAVAHAGEENGSLGVNVEGVNQLFVQQLIDTQLKA